MQPLLPIRPHIAIVDNGSVRPDAVFTLRRLATQLNSLCGLPVHPVSVMHSDRIPASDLAGQQACTLQPWLEWQFPGGEGWLIVLPYILADGGAIHANLLRTLHSFAATYPDFHYTAGPCLFDARAPSARIITKMLADNVRQVTQHRRLHNPLVAMVDHGSPRRAAAEVRNRAARTLCARLATESFTEVWPCSMESREGAEYAFNKPLLEELLHLERFASRDMVVSLFFLSPGKHAGRGGDIEEIIEASGRHLYRESSIEPLSSACSSAGQGRVFLTPTLGEHPLMPQALAANLQDCPGMATLAQS